MADAPCAGCGKRMGDGDFVTVLGKEYHMECFACGICRKVFGEREAYTEYRGKPVHEDCLPKKAAITPAADSLCAGCNKSIAPGTDFFKLSHQQGFGPPDVYHLQCVLCVDCNKPIGDGKYALQHGNPVHLTCMHGAERANPQETAKEFAEDLVCVRCGEPIRGQKKTVPEFGSFHLTCFKCSLCNLGITKDYTKDPVTGKPRCHRCK